jgi:hypothetical protein
MLLRTAFRTLIPGLLLVTMAACGGTSNTASGSPSAPFTTPAASAQAKPITRIEMARALANDGSAASPTMTFDSATDQRLIAVLTLANLDSGTKISYTRYIDNKYVNSKTAVLKKRSKFFHFTFKPKAGATFTPGQYRMKFYVNEKAAGEISFAVQ